MKTTLEEWERRQAASEAMVKFLETWVVSDLCSRFKTLLDAAYSDTVEFQLLKALAEDPSPQSLQLIASRCGASRTLVLPNGRLRRALERLERAGLVLRTGGEERPRYSLNRGDPTFHLIEELYEMPRQAAVVSASLTHAIGHYPH